MDEELGNKDGMANATGNIGSVYSDQHDYARAVAWHFKGLKMYEEIGSKKGEAVFLGDIGRDYLSMVLDTTSSRPATVNGLPMPYKTDSLAPKDRTARLHKAVAYLDKAISYDKEISSLNELQSDYRSLSTADSLLGNYKGSLIALSQYIIIKDSVFSKENSMKIARLEYQKKAATDSLKNAQEKHIVQLKYQQQRTYTYFGIAGVIALVGFSFFMLSSNKLLMKEKKRSDDLLLNILPSEVAEELKTKGAAAARQYDDVTVLFTDFVDFTKAGERMSPQQLVNELDNCFKAFDGILSKYNIEKIKTVGDAYIAVSGLPAANPNHAADIVAAAVEIACFMEQRKSQLGDETFEIRIGIHSGSVVAGIVGVKKFAYDIWGDTVNIAARMEQNSEPGKINISETTHELVKDKFECAYRGEIEAKNKGAMKMYFVRKLVTANQLV